MTMPVAPPDGDTNTAEATASRPVHRLPFWVNQRLGLLVLIVSLSALFGVLRPAFLDERLVLFPLLRDISTLTVVALAQMVVLSVGHMNLAVGRMAAFGALFAGFGYDRLGLPLPLGLLLCLFAGAAIGALTGWIITRTGVSSFVVTLAMDFALLGLVSLLYSALTENAAFTTKPSGLAELRSYSLADICVGPVCGSPAVPQLAQFTVLALLGLGFLYACTRIGRELLLTGANPAAAELSGIPTGRRVILAHTLSGLLAALAGFMAAVSTGTFRASIGDDFMLPSFLGAVLGGTLLTGGVVSVLGVLLGTSLVGVIRKGLDLLGVGLESLNIYLGCVLLLALSADRVRTVLSYRKVVRST
ncbi:ABC transporter permease [Streptomyces sp. NBC_00841]|uniref:ABC transporter permease n=2 Tax=unclassified Streptomyces TaxID=2593676 RepID=UPI00225A7B31|nr:MULTISPECIES: ABC transporter permease [unclassified Streptomyces]MCX4536657.1 ABC transporter permease [Streptomyces sp. NBC_01669]WRZ98121.1 ABC transporter permease [Streptomyces sp. NBC_00841]